jgi:membrane-bound metal-dependent hydrolase YbcI (DUF457 family)
MFIGHFGAAFAAKKIDNKPSLGTLFMASQFIDLLWPIFLILGLEKVKIDPGNTAFTPLDFIYYPFTHSLFGTIVWAILFAGIYYLIKKNLKISLILAMLVISHWLLDFLTHRPDLLIFPFGDYKVGLGLWNSIPATLVVESLIFASGIFLYFKSTRAKNKVGNIGLWSLIVFLIVVYLANIFGPPPPSENEIGYAGLALWILVAWAYWVDKNRVKL